MLWFQNFFKSTFLKFEINLQDINSVIWQVFIKYQLYAKD